MVISAVLCRCAYDSSGSFLAAAPHIPDAAVAWSFPTSTSAAWNSGHSWALLFTQQAQHDAFRGTIPLTDSVHEWYSTIIDIDNSPISCTSKVYRQNLVVGSTACIPSRFLASKQALVGAQVSPCFAALLVEWQAATKARQSLSADAKTSSDDSGASAETDTSRAFQACFFCYIHHR